MSLEENKAIVRRYYEEALNERNFSIMDETYAVDIVHHDPSNPKDIEGAADLKQRFVQIISGFPDLYYTIDDMIAEGDKVVVRWRADLTHTGEFEGLPPTGKRAVVQGIFIHRLAGGKMVEDWALRDTLGLLQQLDVIPARGD
ncbi:MAG: ester cyclase [Anaerolineaceae bacterium]|nr:MAG: ester cyclase [Anaerolineaceae bacterium]